jgi:hypothetical protein
MSGAGSPDWEQYAQGDEEWDAHFLNQEAEDAEHQRKLREDPKYAAKHAKKETEMKKMMERVREQRKRRERRAERRPSALLRTSPAKKASPPERRSTQRIDVGRSEEGQVFSSPGPGSETEPKTWSLGGQEGGGQTSYEEAYRKLMEYPIEDLVIVANAKDEEIPSELSGISDDWETTYERIGAQNQNYAAELGMYRGLENLTEMERRLVRAAQNEIKRRVVDRARHSRPGQANHIARRTRRHLATAGKPTAAKRASKEGGRTRTTKRRRRQRRRRTRRRN